MLLKSLTRLFNQLSKFGSTISGKVTMLAFSLVVISAITIAVFFFHETSKTLAQKELENITHDVKLKSVKLIEAIQSLSDDVLFLSRTPPITEISRNPAMAIDQTNDEWLNKLSSIFSNFLLSRPDYLQLQLIHHSEAREQLLQIEHSNQQVVVRRGNNLPAPKYDTAFNHTIKLAKNEVYLSDVTPRRFGDVHSNEQQFTILAATPIFSVDEELLAIIIIELNFTRILNNLLTSHVDDSHNYVVNQYGHLLGEHGSDAHNITTPMEGNNIFSVFPNIREAFFDNTKNSLDFEINNESDHFLMYLHKVYYHPQYSNQFVGISEAVSYNTIQSRIREPINRILVLTLALVLAATLLALFLARLITRPLNNIIQAIEAFGTHGGQTQLPKDADGEVGILAHSFSKMVNQVKERREKLRQNESFIRNVIDNAPDGIITITNHGMVRSYNPGAESIFGYSADEIIGRDAKTLVSDAFMDFHNKHFSEHTRSINNSTIYSAVEATGIHKNGDLINLEISLAETKLNDQPIYIASVRDITGKKQIENELKLSAKVMDTALEAIMITDADTKIQVINPAFENITGYTLNDIIGETPAIFESDQHSKTYYARIWSTVRETGSWKGELWVNRKNGDVYPKWMSISAIHDDDGNISHYVGIFSDITERKLAEKRLEHLANYDPLTDLPNRRLFHDRLEQAIQRAQRKKSQFGLLFLDIDHFKVINDTLGHNSGDQLLIEVADRLHFNVRKSDTVARLAGDEFTIILDNIETSENATMVAKNIITALSKPFNIGSQKCFSGVSIGISLYPKDGADSETLLKHADVAMYHAKEKGRNNFQQYHASMSTSIVHRLQLETQLRHALENKDFVLHYQPQYDLNTNTIVGAEALIRWKQPDGTLLFPDKFIPTAEETRLILPIGDLVIEEACRQHAQWRKLGFGNIRISVNVSANQLNHRNSLPQTIKEILKKYQIDAKYLELEFTESVLIEQNPHTKTTLNGLRELGVPLSLDDFGTGYASLSQLKRFPFRVIKIDRSFVKDIPHDQDNTEIVRAIIAMSKSLDRIVIAEGVENTEQLNCLRDLKCDQVQGYLFSRAVPGEDFTSLFSQNHPQ